jgi:hypothetical protein
VVVVIVGSDWDAIRYGVLVKVDDAACEGMDGASMCVATACMIMTSPRTPFFCLVKTKEANATVSSCASGAMPGLMKVLSVQS